MHIDQASIAELQAALAKYQQQHQQLVARKLNLDLTRGKPSTEQLNLSDKMQSILVGEHTDPNGVDLRNYGGIDGIASAKNLFGEILGLAEEDRSTRVLVGGNSSLSLMHYTLWFAYYLGLKPGDTSWAQQEKNNNSITRFICPCPGYDRHFSLCSQLGIEMIPVSLTGHGPDMDEVESLIKADPSIKGIWCVPRFSNPTGEVYSDETVTRIAKLGKMAGDNFFVLWDNAYAVHTLNNDAQSLASIDKIAKSLGTLDSIIQFGSTSKITFASAGIGYMASSEANIKGFIQHFGKASIGPDKSNQMRHVKLLKDLANVQQHMAKHAKIITPKFAAVKKSLEENIGGTGMGDWNNPNGGYFVSFNTRPGLAKKVISLAAEAGVKLTPAGATYPEGNDPQDTNIRIAPTYPELDDVEAAMAVLVNCVLLASIEQKLVSQTNNQVSVDLTNCT